MRRPAIWIGLIGFDLLRMRRGFEIVLARWQDRLALLLMAAFAALAASTMFDRPPGLAVEPSWAALGALFLGASVAAVHERRLEAAAQRSIAAPLALAPTARAAHLATISTLSLLLSLVAARAMAFTGFFDWSVIGLVISAWAAGTLLGTVGASLRRRRLWRPAPATTGPGAGVAPDSTGLLAITLRTQLPFRSSQSALLAAFALGAAQAMGAGIVTQGLNPFAGGALAVAAALASSFAVARVPAAPCRFGTFAGVPTAHALAAHLAVPAAATAGAFLGALVHHGANPGLPWLELGCGLAVAVVVAFRVLHYRLGPKLRADRLMQIQIVVLATAAAGLPPLALLLVLFRAVALYRASRHAMWAAS